MNFPAASDADEFKFRRHQHKLLGLCDRRGFCPIRAQARVSLAIQEKDEISGLFLALPLF